MKDFMRLKKSLKLFYVKHNLEFLENLLCYNWLFKRLVWGVLVCILNNTMTQSRLRKLLIIIISSSFNSSTSPNSSLIRQCKVRRKKFVHLSSFKSDLAFATFCWPNTKVCMVSKASYSLRKREDFFRKVLKREICAFSSFWLVRVGYYLVI